MRTSRSSGPRMTELGPVLAIAQRDLMRLLRDRPRLITTLFSPLLLIGVLGGTLQANLGKNIGFNFLAFTFTGVLGMTLFQSSAQGVISLINDRENDFSQEMFVSPVSRYSIVFGKILGESGVAMIQALPTFVMAWLLRVPLTAPIVALLIAG